MSIFFPEDEGREVPNVNNQPILRTEIIAGEAGPTGSQGPAGPVGPGVVTGGFTGQVLAKKSNANYDTEWVTGSGGGSAIWGGIAGTLSNQTDLQTVLDAKAPSSGISPSAISGTAVITTDSRLSDSRTPTGAASGDLAGTFPAPEVIKLRGYSVSLTSPSNNQAILFNSSATAFQNSTLTIGTISGLSADLSGKAETTGVQIFTSSGTWTKPTGAKVINIQLLAGGGGGGGGFKNVASTNRSGGAGGGGGGCLSANIPAQLLPETPISITIGAGGLGGSGSTNNGVNGGAGVLGGATIFGSGASGEITYIATGGAGGGGGSGAASAVGFGSLNANSGGQGNIGNGAVGQPSAANSNHFMGGAGGGGAGGINNSNAISTGLNGGRSNLLNLTGGASNGGAGQNNTGAVNGLFAVGSGGGGGNSSRTVDGTSGGNGGFPSSGGGGGGASEAGNGGAGGTGGAGMAIITTYF